METLEETTVESDYDEPTWKKDAQTSYSRKNCNHFLHEDQAEPNRQLFLELFDQDPDVECTIDDAIFKDDEENVNVNKKKKNNKLKDEEFFTQKYQRKLEKKKARLQEIFENSSVYQNLQKLKTTPLNIQEVDIRGNVTKRYEYYYDYEQDKHDLVEIKKDGFESPVIISPNEDVQKEKPVKQTNKIVNKRKRKVDENLNINNENNKVSKYSSKKNSNQDRTLKNKNNIIEKQQNDDENVIMKNKVLDNLIQPSQKKMRSSSYVKNSSMIGLNRKEFNLTVDFSLIEKNESLIKNLDTTLVTSFLSAKQSKNLLNVFKSSAFSRNVEKESDCFLEETLNYKENLDKLCVSISESISSDHFTLEKLEGLSQKEKVLHFCKPQKISNFKTVLKMNKNNKIKKISEGSYGEVFSMSNQNKEEIIKIIKLPNDSIESACGAILPEILVSFALNDLQNKYRFSNFIQLKKCSFVQDKYPKCLLDAWNEYDELKESENEDPSNFDEKSQFVVLFLENGGLDLESYQKLKPSEALSIIKQIILSVALAEMNLKFEHRDLHLGNLLIKNTDEENLIYYIDDKKYSIKSSNLKVSIIDYSLTRFSKDGIVIYDDLNQYPEIFEGEGDLQYDIYRKMKELNNGDWKSFNPKTNIVWLDFILKKISKLIPSRVSKEEKVNLNILKKLNKDLIEFDSCLNALELITEN